MKERKSMPKENIRLSDIYKLLNMKTKDINKIEFSSQLLSEVLFDGGLYHKTISNDLNVNEHKTQFYINDNIAILLERSMGYGKLTESLMLTFNYNKEQIAIIKKLNDTYSEYKIKLYYFERMGKKTFEGIDSESIDYLEYLGCNVKTFSTYNFTIEDYFNTTEDEDVYVIELSYRTDRKRIENLFSNGDYLNYLTSIWGKYVIKNKKKLNTQYK